MNFTDEHRELLAEGRVIRSDCVLEVVPDDLCRLWRSDGWPVRTASGYLMGTGLQPTLFLMEKQFGDAQATRDELVTALREGRVLGLDWPGAAWALALTPPAPAKWEPKPGDHCEGEWDDGTTWRGYYAPGTFYGSDNYANLLIEPNGSSGHLVTRESLRPVATPVVATTCDRCGTKCESLQVVCSSQIPGEYCSLECCEKQVAASLRQRARDEEVFEELPSDPYRVHRLTNVAEAAIACGPPEATSRLTQGIAAARAASAREGMGAPLVKRGKRVTFIPPYLPQFEWPSVDDE